jgi:hypothetical protein
MTRNQTVGRALLGMESKKPYEPPVGWPEKEPREAKSCLFCGARDHGYEECPKRAEAMQAEDIKPASAELRQDT